MFLCLVHSQSTLTCLLQYSREKYDAPSNFTTKLRKHVRNRRLEAVRQLGVDRIVDFTFGVGDTSAHVILELFAQGNVVLADSAYTVLTLLRSHRDDAKEYVLMPRHPYPLNQVGACITVLFIYYVLFIK